MMDLFASRVSSRSALVGLQESQGERVLKALKRVYEKIHNLERDRNSAKDDIKTIGEVSFEQPSAGEFFRRLATAEARCKLLEEQLSHVRFILSEISLDKSVTSSVNSFQFNNEGKSFDSLEANFTVLPPVSLFLQHLRLQSKIRNNQKRKTKVIKQHTSDSSNKSEKGSFVPENGHFNELDSHCEPQNQIKELSRKAVLEKPSLAETNSEELHTHFQKSNCCSVATSTQTNCERCRRDCNNYCVNMAAIPFVSATTSNSKSHSLRANIQSLHSMVKYCNPAICSAAPLLHRRRSVSLERPTSNRGRRLSRCNSASELGLTSNSIIDKSRVKSQYEDLDVIPVHLKASKSKLDKFWGCQAEESHVCIKSELRSGQQRVLEVKMTTPATPKASRSRIVRKTPQQENRQFLQDLKHLQFCLKQN